MKFATRLVQYDPAPGDPLQPMATPIYQTATFEQTHADSFGAFDYSRSGNPTRKVLEDRMAVLEGGTHAFAFASGVAAISNVMHLLSAGDEILADWDLYGGASRIFGKVINRFGIETRFSDANDLDRFAAAITPATKMLYVESPTNPFLRILDLAAIAKLAHERGLLLVVDSSAMSPYLQNPLLLGADIVIHSATKYLCGHSDVTGGVVVVKDADLAKQIHFLQNAEGNALSPFDSFLLLRGIKTLKLRLDAQQKNAQKVVEFLKSHPKAGEVFYPGDPAHPGYELQRRQATGAGSLLCFRAGSLAAAKRIAEDTKLFSIAVSFGSVSSTISIPVTMSHAGVPAEMRERQSIPDDLLRLSIGIEDSDDLIADLREQLDLL